MSLPLTWVERIFDKLMLAYGRDFTGRWEGLPISSVKTDWSHELSGFETHPESIKHALQNLPPARPPTVYEFRNLCASAPKKALFELPAPPADPLFVASIAAKLRAPTGKANSTGKEWAYRLQERDKAGEPLNMNQRRCYQAAIGEAA